MAAAGCVLREKGRYVRDGVTPHIQGFSRGLNHCAFLLLLLSADAHDLLIRSIPGGLNIGSKIYIHGMVPEVPTKFALNLQRGADPELADIHLHFRAELGVPALVVRNSRLGGLWGVEEHVPLPGQNPFPLAPKAFLLVLTAYLDSYEVEVNGSWQRTFEVRDGLPISSVTHLAIEAGILIRAIHEPVESMPRNLRLNFGDGVKVGDMVFIKGQPTDDAKSFVVNWQTGPGKFDDVLFQLRPDLEAGRVAANCRLDDEWGEGEEESSPLERGAPFSLVVGVTSLGFETRLDGREWIQFRHRQDVGGARTLFLEGDLQPADIWIDSAQSNTPPAVNGMKSRGSRLQLICPELPVTSRILGGFEKGCLLILSARVNAEPKNFRLRLQCGEEEGDESDVALQYEVKYAPDGSSSLITLNSREEGTWGQALQEKVVEGPGPLRPFDLLVARTEEGFLCFLDGAEHAANPLPYRLLEEDQTTPDHVTLSGDLETYRLLLL